MFDDHSLVLIEGSNSCGCFLSIQVQRGWVGESYVIIPAGKKGYQWLRIASLFGRFCNSRSGDSGIKSNGAPRLGLLDGTRVMTNMPSYKDVLGSSSLDLLSVHGDGVVDSRADILDARLAALERDFAEILGLMRTLAAAGSSGQAAAMVVSSAVGKTKDSRLMEQHLTDA